MVLEGFCVIFVGGVDSVDDVAERLTAGANLIQKYTTFLYHKPM